jgi:proline iminopeptidase
MSGDSMPQLYPEIEPYVSGILDVSDGHSVYWEVYGNPTGKPVVALHGGPGSGSNPRWARFFNPDRYRIVLFDQRGCGRSRPLVSEPNIDLSTNTTHHLIADIEALRALLDIDRWLVFGASWGSTLGLAYAEQFPHHVSGVILFCVVTTTKAEVDWITKSMGRVFPEEWNRFREGVPVNERDGSLVDAYCRLLHDPDPVVREKAARDWCAWEDTHVATVPNYVPDPRFDDPEFRMIFARLVTHYWRHAAWLEDGALIRDVANLAGIPGFLAHGRLDISGPSDIAWKLAQSWPGCELVIVDDVGHSSAGSMTEVLVGAADRFASLV